VSSVVERLLALLDSFRKRDHVPVGIRDRELTHPVKLRDERHVTVTRFLMRSS